MKPAKLIDGKLLLCFSNLKQKTNNEARSNPKNNKKKHPVLCGYKVLFKIQSVKAILIYVQNKIVTAETVHDDCLLLIVLQIN